ncbi:MAG: peptidyl-prolyl cis-trans isomerase [Pirellulaceae bacterium]
MICPRRTLIFALALHAATLVAVRAAVGQAPPRYPLTQQFQQFNGPAPPTVPGTQAQRPVAPGTPSYSPPAAGPSYPPPRDPRMASAPPQSPPKQSEFAPTQVIARVGSHTILAGELLGPINQALEPYMDQIPPDQLPEQRAMLMKRMLPAVIETKMVYLDFVRDFPDKKRLPEVQKSLFDQFDEKQLPKVMEKAGVTTPAELDRKLRTYGSSLFKTKKSFSEQVVAQQMVQQNIDFNPQIIHEELREYYQQHLSDYGTPAQARWEQLMVRHDRFPSGDAARAALAEMGNEVLRGAPFAAVARQKSQGFTAAKGGFHDWTTKGSLVSEPLDRNLFTLPIGRLSQIIADDQGLHIIRVIERREAAQVPFKASPTIRLGAVAIGPHERVSTQTLVVAQIENSGAAAEAVEATVYVRGEPIITEKIVVPAFGASEVRFELEKIDPNEFTEEDFKVDIETQTRIRALIRQDKIRQQREEYLSELRERTPIWTVFGDILTDAQTAANAAESSSR